MKNRPLWLRILWLAQAERKILAWGTLFLVIASASNLIYPQAIRTMLDQALTAKSMDKINQISLIMLIVFVVQAVASSLRYYLFTLAGERTVLRLREKLYGHILDQEIAFFDFNKTGDLMSRLSSDTAVLQNAVSVNISMGLRSLAGAVGGICLMIYTSPWLALSMLLIIPPVAVGAAIFGKRIRVFSRKAQDALAEASIVAEETLGGMRTVRSFAQENFEKARYATRLAASLVAVRSRIFQISIFMGLASLVGYTAIAGIVWAGGREVVLGQLSVGDLTQFLIYLLLVAFSVGSLGGLWGDFMAAVGAAKRLFDILEREPQVALHDGLVLESVRGHISFQQISFCYPARPEQKVLDQFTLDVEPNQVIALVGPSGSGKTTIASLLSRFYDPLSGNIFLDGQDLNKISPHSLRLQIGLVSQEPILISASVEENIRYANPAATIEQVREAARAANADEFIMKFPDQYKTMVGERGIQLSGGQKQRVAIARAILKNPKILILDEATSALDTESEALVQQALTHLMKGRTTLVIAHRLATIQNADLICVLENGKIMEKGNHKELVAKESGLYRKLVERQMRH